MFFNNVTNLIIVGLLLGSSEPSSDVAVGLLLLNSLRTATVSQTQTFPLTEEGHGGSHKVNFKARAIPPASQLLISGQLWI